MKYALILCFLSLLSSITYGRELEREYVFNGKNYVISYTLRSDHQEIYLNGVVLSGVVEKLEGFKRVRKLIRKDVPVKLILQSGGGFQKLYNSLFRAIKKNCNQEETGCEVTTYVASYSYCMSACIPLFMVGDKRIAGKEARFGFHQGSVVPGALMIPGMVEKELLKRGVSEEWIDGHKQMFQSLNITSLYPRDMKGSNIVTSIENR